MYILLIDTYSIICIPLTPIKYALLPIYKNCFHDYISTFIEIIRSLVTGIENSILRFNTRTARERRTTRLNILNHARARHKPRKKVNLCRLACISNLTINVSSTQTNKSQPCEVTFDTDSIPIRVDNCATASISNNLKDFEGPLTPVRGRVKGISGYTNVGMKKGIIKWDIEDDTGRTHTIRLPGSYYIPGATSRILSPQHWAQTARDIKPLPRGTWCATYEDQVVLYWNQRKYVRTIHLDRSESNTAAIRTAPGYSKFLAFEATHQISDEDVLTYDAPEAAVVSDDEYPNSEELQDDDVIYRSQAHESHTQRESPLTTQFELDGPNDSPELPTIIEDEEDRLPQDASAEFLRWHHKLGHMSPKKIRIMAYLGILPRRLANCRIPLCTTCLFGKATKKPWRAKTPANKYPRSLQITKPGHCVSVDQLQSSTPGLIAQLKGNCTVMRYTVATVFIDHYSGLGQVHLQKSTSAIETVQAKQAFERYAATHGVLIRHYHADNGCFTDNEF